mmetsp:Transcript_10589/g.10685  ORF Transcript_10589/g.10685 Transcript_10589/m.10685 type:complete len:176 (-) Transcript_10589:573-1100(-)
MIQDPMKETIAKSVVLQCVQSAHRQKRSCIVVSFSSGGCVTSQTMEMSVDGLRNVLEFLDYRFGGGTDVTGAITHVMKLHALSSPSDSTNKQGLEMASSDLVLITDGEIPDPPISNDMMEELDQLKRKTGMEIHGLLVGDKESIPLEKLCTQVHTCLMGLDTQSMLLRHANAIEN